MKKRVLLSLILTMAATIMFCVSVKKEDILVVISISILSFLLFVKLTSYLADFKNIKHQSRIDIFFLVVFFIFLFIPMSHIDDSNKSKYENRYLAKFKPLIEKKKFNYDFGKNYNEWFNDRFALRKELIKLNDTTHCLLSREFCVTAKSTWYKKYNLVIRASFWGMQNIDNDTNDAKFDEYLTNVINLQNYCKKNDIKLYFLIIPRQADFFDYKYPDRSMINKDYADEIIEYLRKNSDVKIIYPKKELIKANKETPVYFKTDHHWSKKGAYVGYYALLKEIKKDFPNISIVDENSLIPYYDKKVQYWWNSDFTYGQALEQLNISKKKKNKILDTEYLYYKNPNTHKLKVVENNISGLVKFDEEFYYPESRNIKAALISNSFGRNLVEFLPYSFKYTLRLYDNYRKMQFKIYEPIIEKYKPDILIISFQTAYMPNLLNLFNDTIDEGK